MRPTFTDAREHRTVLLPDGRTGTLQHITRQSKIATVVLGGRRFRFPLRDVKVLFVHLLPGDDGILPCCGRPAGAVPYEDRLTDDPGSVFCPRQVVE